MMHGSYELGYGGGHWMVWWGLPWWSWALTVVMVVLGVWFSGRILEKAGHSPWWSLLFLFPMLSVVGLWVFAFVRWPRVDAVHVTPPSDYEGGWNVAPRPGGRRDEPPGGERGGERGGDRGG